MATWTPSTSLSPMSQWITSCLPPRVYQHNHWQTSHQIAVHQSAHFSEYPKTSHEQTVKWIICYLKFTKD
jgi:hypothetical protein